MSIYVKRWRPGVVVLVLLMVASNRLAAQTTTSSAGQSVSNLPQQVKTNGENRLVAKTNTVSNNAADKVDTLGTKAFNGFVGMFKKKKKPAVAPATPGATSTPPKTDSTGVPKPGL
jgi:hypothetical protein